MGLPVLSMADILDAIGSNGQGTHSPVSEVTPRLVTRTLSKSDILPDWIDEAVRALPIDYEWVWIVADQDQPPEQAIQGILIAAHGHGMVIPMRLQVGPLASRNVLVCLLRKSLADWQEKGYNVYVTTLDPENASEEKLMRVISRAGGGMVGKGLVFSGLVATARRY